MFGKIQQAIKPHLEKAHIHPFIDSISGGTLSPDKYLMFVEQDYLFIMEEYEAFKLMETRLNNNIKLQLVLRRLVAETQQTKLNFHKYLLEPQTPNLFQSYKRQTNKIPIISDYTEHILTHAKYSHLAKGLVTILPCYFIYFTVGLKMRHKTKENNPYLALVKSFSSDKLQFSMQSIIRATDELSQNLSPIEKEEVINIAIKSTELELNLWDYIYAGSFEDQNKCSLTLSDYRPFTK